MVKIKSLILGLVTLVLLVSCVGAPRDISQKICELPPKTNSSLNSSNLTVNVYVDGTPSMEGYVNQASTRYQKTLELLERTFSLNSKKVNYNRLGTNIQQIQRSQFFRDALQPKFYSGNKQYPRLSVSEIDKAIKPGNDNQMNVIITDLYQKDSDITKVNLEIKNNYLNSNLVDKGYAVGVMAIKSEFQGTVYTELSSKSQFSYNTQGKKPNQYHPFYVIFLGKYSDIDTYFTKLIQNGEEFIQDSKFVIFSPRSIVKETLHFPTTDSLEATVINANNNKTYKNYWYSTINNRRVKAIRKGNPLELLGFGQRERNEISIEYELPASYSQYSLPLKNSSVEARIKTKYATSYILNSSKNSPKNPKTYNEIKLSKFKFDREGEKFKFTTTIHPKKIRKNKIHTITADIIATELEEPTWWKEWNSRESNLTDGSKTYNLRQFFQGLKEITTDLMTENDSKSNIGRFCYVIQKG